MGPSRNPLDEAFERLERRERDERARAEIDAEHLAVPPDDAELDALCRSFVERMPPGSEVVLLRRWSEEVTETHFPPSGLLRRRRPMPSPARRIEWRTEVVGRGWPLLAFGRDVVLRRRSSDDRRVTPEVTGRFTVAIGLAGELLPAVVSEGAVVVEGEATHDHADLARWQRSARRAPSSPDLGRFTGASRRSALLERFAIEAPKVAVGMGVDPATGRQITLFEPDPTWDGHVAVFEALADAMAIALRDATAKGAPN